MSTPGKGLDHDLLRVVNTLALGIVGGCAGAWLYGVVPASRLEPDQVIALFIALETTLRLRRRTAPQKRGA